MYMPKTLNEYFIAVDDFFKKTFRDDSQLFMSVKTRQHLRSSAPSHAANRDITHSYNEPNLQEINMENHDLTSAPRFTTTTTTPTSAAATAATHEFDHNIATNKNAALGDYNFDQSINSNTVMQHHNNSLLTNSSSMPGNESYIAFSPRMRFNRDGTVFGKVKMYFTFPFHWIGVIENGLMFDSYGVITAVGKVKEMIEGLVLAVRYSVNTIAPASEDVVTTKLDYRHNDFYSTIGYQRNYLGSSNLLVDVGSVFLNMLVGAGFERQQLSYLEQKDEIPQVDAMYGGVGYYGENWTVAAKLTRTREAWSALRVALLQRLSPSTMLSWSYNLNMALATTHTAVGFSQRFSLRLPSFLTTTTTSTSATTSTPNNNNNYIMMEDNTETNKIESEKRNNTFSLVHEIPFIGACKAESNGLCSLTVRGVLSECVWYGIVLQKNFLDQANNKVRCGLVINMNASDETVVYLSK